MKPNLLNNKMINIIKKRKKNKKSFNTNNSNFVGVFIICASIIAFYLRYIIYNN